jgi:hypothetical protein
MINLGSSLIQGIRLGTKRVSAIYLGETPITFNSAYTLGEYYPDAGGYIYYLNGSGGGQVALYQNVISGSVTRQLTWGGVGGNVTGTFSSVTSGNANTIAMNVTSGSFRVWSEIQNLNSSSVIQNAGFTDWYIPSIDAYGYVYDNLASQNIAGPWDDYPGGGGTGQDRSYWSSTQASTQNAWSYQMTDGPFTSHGPSNLNRKDTNLMLRPVRTFTSGSFL